MKVFLLKSTSNIMLPPAEAPYVTKVLRQLRLSHLYGQLDF